MTKIDLARRLIFLAFLAAIVPALAGQQADRPPETTRQQSGGGVSTTASPEESPGGQAISFGEEFLDDPANIEAGKKIWQEQCRHCHGKAAYPGKAPKLKPRRYTPEFVYDRVTYGFRKMPAWKEVYSKDERKAVVAYVLSRDFSP